MQHPSHLNHYVNSGSCSFVCYYCFYFVYRVFRRNLWKSNVPCMRVRTPTVCGTYTYHNHKHFFPWHESTPQYFMVVPFSLRIFNTIRLFNIHFEWTKHTRFQFPSFAEEVLLHSWLLFSNYYIQFVASCKVQRDLSKFCL